MQFSNTSQELFDFTIENFNKCLIKNTENEQKIQNKMFDKFFLDIREADKYIKTIHAFHNCLTGLIKEIETTKQLKLPLLGNYFPLDIKKDIELNTINQIIYSCEINNKKIFINFFTSNHEIDITIYNKYAKQIFMLIAILTHYSSKECSQILNIYIYFTDFKRMLPDKNYDILEHYNVNGGLTTTCDKNSEIFVYRKEEWFKVLTHELFHNLGLDFSAMDVRDIHNKIKKLFPIDSKINLYESYCEFWARLLNLVFCSYNVIDNKNDKETFVLCMEFFIQIERIFSLFQCNKILNFLGLRYKDLYNNDNASKIARENLYREKTNVFAYYVVTTFLLDNYINVMTWCNDNNLLFFQFNNTKKTLDLFYNLIESSYSRNSFLKNLECVSNSTEKYKKNKRQTKYRNKEFNKHDILKTTRMTIMEFK